MLSFNDMQDFEKIRKADLAIFDLDGTLVDSLDQILMALNHARTECNLEKATREMLKRNLGLPFEQLNSDLSLDLIKLQILKNLFRSKLLGLILENNLIYPGVLQLLPLIKNSGINVAIATSKPQNLAEAVVQNSDLNKYVDYVQGTDDFDPKPNPEVIIRVLTHFKTNSAFMVGDRTEDIRAGRSANLPTVGLAQSSHSIDDLKLSGATLAYKNVNDFFEAWVS